MSHAQSCQRLQSLSAIIFWGAIWSSVEACSGYMVSRIGTPYIGLVTFLITMPCLALAYRQTGLKLSSLYIAIVASLIRCMHLPFMGHESVIFTSVSLILVEGMVMSAFVTVAQLKPASDGLAFTLKPFWTSVTLTLSVMLTIAM